MALYDSASSTIPKKRQNLIRHVIKTSKSYKTRYKNEYINRYIYQRNN